MAGSDKPISGLPTASVPLAGTEYIPIVQDGITKKVSSASLTTSGVLTTAENITGVTLNSSVTGSSLTSVGTLSSLSVSGSTTLNTVVYDWPSSDGSGGQVLSTDGSGQLSWIDKDQFTGTTTNSLSAGGGLTGGSFNGATPVTFAVDFSSANTASKIVARDGSGNFAAGTITANLSGNASTATSAATLTTPRNINGVAFNGSADITVPAAAGTLTGSTINASVTASSLTSVGTLTSLTVSGATTLRGVAYTWPLTDGTSGQFLSTNGGGTLSWATASGGGGGGGTTTYPLTAGSYLTGGTFDGSAPVTFAVDATTTNTASKVVARDASGNFSAGTITAALSGNATTATTLQTARSINGVSFNGSADITVAAAAGTLTGSALNSGVTSSSLTSVGTLTSGAIGTGFTAIPNTALANSSVTVNGTSISLGGSGTVTAAAGTLTGTTLNSSVVSSSLTSVGTLSSLTVSGTTTLNTVAYTWPASAGSNGQVLTSNGSGTLSWTTVSGGGGGSGTKTFRTFTPLDNQPPASNFATLDTRNSVAVLDFDAATDESAVFVGTIPEGASLGSGIKVIIFWAATTATSGDCVWGIQFEKTSGDIDSDSFDTATTGSTTTSGTSGIVNTTSITTTNIDSLTAGDLFRLKVYRDANDGADTMTGDAELIALKLEEV